VIESFNGRFRDECLNREVFASVLEAQVIARTFRDEYNTIRPHSTISYKLPAEYRAELLRQAPGSGQGSFLASSRRRALISGADLAFFNFRDAPVVPHQCVIVQAFTAISLTGAKMSDRNIRIYGPPE
jgi:hypothetical protein